jgi:hypothetical protein
MSQPRLAPLRPARFAFVGRDLDVLGFETALERVFRSWCASRW